jgi:putative SOS response-associated peptidase YedK
MCGRFTLRSDLDELQDRFAFEAMGLSHQPSYNIVPTQRVLTVVNKGRNRAEYMRWGLIPSWAGDVSIGARMINARAETLAEKPSFRQALQKRRCLVLADGFYEWRKAGSKKIPMYIALKSREPFGMAGLWETWKAPSGETVHSCTIITTPPNSLMEPIHNRMPAILPRQAEAAWLAQDIEDQALLTGLLRPRRSEDMESYEVSTLVNSPSSNAPECILPVGYLV